MIVGWTVCLLLAAFACLSAAGVVPIPGFVPGLPFP